MMKGMMDIGILQVADRLNIRYRGTGVWRKALCFCHDDHTPSLGLNTATNRWKCFSCGKGGDVVQLVMEHEGLGFREACDWLGREFVGGDSPYERKKTCKTFKTECMNLQHTQYLDPALLEKLQGSSNEFTRALVQTGILTPAQMRHACDTFQIGTVPVMSKNGERSEGVVFWQIDAVGNVREGKVMFYQADAHRSATRKPLTLSWLLKREGQLSQEWRGQGCLFGLHQLQEAAAGAIIAVVESEKTAVICSELLHHLPQGGGATTPVIWMATGGMQNLSVQALMPLKGRRVILFPDTDTTGHTYREWSRIAAEASKAMGQTITVTDMLERHATAEQKAAKADVADMLGFRL